MRTLFLECNAGISGDMLVAAMLDMGADREALDKALTSIPLQGFTYKISRVKKVGLDCCDFAVILDAEHANHDHDMDYLHGHSNAFAFKMADHAHCHEHHHHGHGEHHHAHGSKGKEEVEHQLPSHMPENEHLLDHGNERAYHDGFYSEHDYMHEHEMQLGHEFLQAHKPHILANHVDEQHDHHEHHHDHHHEHRGLPEIQEIIAQTDMTEAARAIALKIFDILADAEAKAHGVDKNEVHFHEVGAVDSIVDIIAIAVCYDSLNVDALFTFELCEGRGTIRCQHGILPIPVPATANILCKYQIPVKYLPVEGEFVTPTGAAAVAALLVDRVPQDFHIVALGMGAGKRNYELPSVLRATILVEEKEEDLPDLAKMYGDGETDHEENMEDEKHTELEQCLEGIADMDDMTFLMGQMGQVISQKFGYTDDAPPSEIIFKLETNLDDISGETLGYVMEKLLEVGALDVCYVPIYMKKNRPACQLQVLCRIKDVAAMEKIIYAETSTLGIRRQMLERSYLERHEEEVNTMYGPIKVKVCETPAGERYAVEYESAAAAAKANNVPLQEVYREVDANFT